MIDHLFLNLISSHIAESLGDKNAYFASGLHFPRFYSLEYYGAVGDIDGSGFAVCEVNDLRRYLRRYSSRFAAWAPDG